MREMGGEEVDISNYKMKENMRMSNEIIRQLLAVRENTHMIFLPLYLLDGPRGDPLRATG